MLLFRTGFRDVWAMVTHAMTHTSSSSVERAHTHSSSHIFYSQSFMVVVAWQHAQHACMPHT